MRVALLCVLGLAAACGDDGVNVSTNESNFCEQIADVVCHNLYQCCTESEIEGYLDVSEPRTENQCREDVKRSCDRSAAEIHDSLEAGRVQLDAARLNDCLNAVLAPDGVCGDVVTELPWSEACSAVPWVGQVQPMGVCYFNVDCAGYPDAFCGPDQKCALKPTAGFPCGGGNQCASDYYCQSNQTCAQKSDLGGTCLNDLQCNDKKDLYCDIPVGSTTGMGTCAMRGAGGTACLKDSACLSSDCVPGKCQGTNQSCYSDLGPPGVGCTVYSSNCTGGICSGRCADDNAPCDEPGDCGVGSCSVSGGACLNDTSYCGLCVGGTNAGAACVSNSSCNSFVCDGSMSTESCLFNTACVPGDCVGEPVCTSLTLTTDYCTAVGVVPNP